MAEFIALLITLGIFVGLPVWIVWSIISRTKKQNMQRKNRASYRMGRM